MNKKFLVLLLLLSNFAYAQNLKDANLIDNFQYKKIKHITQIKKNRIDRKEHLKYRNLLSKEEYQIYLILDRILRANNLQYKNWRIGFNIEKDIINAVSLNNNLILINSSLYDCLHQNDDAIAYAISHELAHFILSHQKETIENSYKIKKLEDDIKKLSSQKNGEVYSRNLKNLINNIYFSQKELELNSDALALELIIRAGYELNLAMEIFDYIDEDCIFCENKNLYPMIYQRKDNLLKEYKILNIEKLKKEGENNLIKSFVLSVQKSIDKETLVINKPINYKEYSFNIKNKYQKFLEKGYDYYLEKDIENAIKYFELAYTNNQNNYIAPLYLSYAYEAKGDIKLAKRYIKKARALKARDENIIKQYKVFYKK